MPTTRTWFLLAPLALAAPVLVGGCEPPNPATESPREPQELREDETAPPNAPQGLAPNAPGLEGEVPPPLEGETGVEH